jgi:hypothetical protein
MTSGGCYSLGFLTDLGLTTMRIPCSGFFAVHAAPADLRVCLFDVAFGLDAVQAPICAANDVKAQIEPRTTEKSFP